MNPYGSEPTISGSGKVGIKGGAFWSGACGDQTQHAWFDLPVLPKIGSGSERVSHALNTKKPRLRGTGVQRATFQLRNLLDLLHCSLERLCSDSKGDCRPFGADFHSVDLASRELRFKSPTHFPSFLSVMISINSFRFYSWSVCSVLRPREEDNAVAKIPGFHGVPLRQGMTS